MPSRRRPQSSPGYGRRRAGLVRDRHFLGQIGADLQNTRGQPGWVGWTLWSIRCELEALSQSDPQAVAELVPEMDRLVRLITHWIEPTVFGGKAWQLLQRACSPVHRSLRALLFAFPYSGVRLIRRTNQPLLCPAAGFRLHARRCSIPRSGNRNQAGATVIDLGASGGIRGAGCASVLSTAHSLARPRSRPKVRPDTYIPRHALIDHGPIRP